MRMTPRLVTGLVQVRWCQNCQRQTKQAFLFIHFELYDKIVKFKYCDEPPSAAFRCMPCGKKLYYKLEDDDAA